MNCENLAATEGFPPILVRAMSVFYAIPVHLNPRVILQIHNSLHYRILIKVWAIWNGMQTATHRNTFAGGQDRTPTAVHTHLSAVWASCCRTVPGRDLHNLLPSHGCCPARSTPVRKSVTTDMHTHARAHTHTHRNSRWAAPGSWQRTVTFLASCIPQKENFDPRCWLHFRGEMALRMIFLLSRCTRLLAVHPRASKSSGFPPSTPQWKSVLAFPAMFSSFPWSLQT